MLSKSNCLSILVSLEDKGIKVNEPMLALTTSKNIPISVLKFIADNRGIEAINFYEMLRRRHNENKSQLYTNILKDTTDVNEIVVILSSLLTQIALYAKKLDKSTSQFKQEIRAEEIASVLSDYYATDNAEKCVAELQLIRADLLVLEALAGRREFA